MSDFRLGDLIQAIDENKEAMNVQLTGSYVRHSESENAFPDGFEGNSLYHYDTEEVFIHDGTEWRDV